MPGQTTDKYAEKEADRSEGTVKCEHEILPRSGSIGLAEHHHAGREDCRNPQACHSATGYEHDVVMAEAGQQGPKEEPSKTNLERNITSELFAYSAEWEKAGASDKGKHTRWPRLGFAGDIEIGCKLGEDDVKATDEIFLQDWGQPKSNRSWAR